LLVERGANINLTNRWDRTPLSIAIANRYDPISFYLIDNGAIFMDNYDSYRNNDPINDFSEDVMIYLIEKRKELGILTKYGSYILCKAYDLKLISFIEYLYGKFSEENIDITQNGHEIIMRAITNLPESITEGLIDKLFRFNENKQNELGKIFNLACKKCSINIIKYLISKGVSVELDNYIGSPMYYATNGSNYNVVEYFLDIGFFGKDIEFVSRYYAFMMFCGIGKLDTIELYFKKGLDEYIKDFSILETAIFSKHMNVIHYLIDNGANFSIPNQVGDALLHIASKEGEIRVVEILIEIGADVNVKNHNDKMNVF